CARDALGSGLDYW
nr:immunoglobulin heavy chain junction region [Macaca mulatta]